MTREFKADFGFVITGTVLAFAGPTAPDGWLMCDGSAYNADTDTTFQPLFDVIENAWGGSGNTDFQVPDLRGEFLRCRDDLGTAAGAAGNDPGDNRVAAGDLGVGDVGSYQPSEFELHVHPYNPATGGFGIWFTGGVGTAGGNTGATGGDETRPRNAYVNFIIKK